MGKISQVFSEILFCVGVRSAAILMVFLAITTPQKPRTGETVSVVVRYFFARHSKDVSACLTYEIGYFIADKKVNYFARTQTSRRKNFPVRIFY